MDIIRFVDIFLPSGVYFFSDLIGTLVKSLHIFPEYLWQVSPTPLRVDHISYLVFLYGCIPY